MTTMNTKEEHSFVLIDSERSSGSDIYFWKANRSGYTSSIEDAGIYSFAEALQIVGQDFDHRTSMLDFEIAKTILEKMQHPNS